MLLINLSIFLCVAFAVVACFEIRPALELGRRNAQAAFEKQQGRLIAERL